MSDREKAGLRGPVQQCTEGTLFLQLRIFPLATYFTTTKYNPEDGRILQVHNLLIQSSPPQTFRLPSLMTPTGLL